MAAYLTCNEAVMGSSPLGGFLQRTNVGRLNVDVWLADLKAYAEMTQLADVGDMII